MPGGQRVAKVEVKSFHQIDWNRDYAITIGPHVGLDGKKVIATGEWVFEDWDEGGMDGGTITYYKLPPMIREVIERAKNWGEATAKAKIKEALGLDR